MKLHEEISSARCALIKGVAQIEVPNHGLFCENGKGCSRVGHKGAQAVRDGGFDSIMHDSVMIELAMEEVISGWVEGGATAAHSRSKERVQDSQGNRAAELSVREGSQSIAYPRLWVDRP